MRISLQTYTDVSVKNTVIQISDAICEMEEVVSKMRQHGPRAYQTRLLLLAQALDDASLMCATLEQKAEAEYYWAKEREARRD